MSVYSELSQWMIASELHQWMIAFFGNLSALVLWSLITLVLTLRMSLAQVSKRQQRRLKRWARASAVNVAISIICIVVINLLTGGYLLDSVEGAARSRFAMESLAWASLFTLLLIPLQCILMVVLSRRRRRERRRRHQYR